MKNRMKRERGEREREREKPPQEKKERKRKEVLTQRSFLISEKGEVEERAFVGLSGIERNQYSLFFF